MRRLFCVSVAVIVLAVLSATVAVAQDATPAAVLGEAIDPAECTVEALPTDEMVALWFQENDAGTPVVATPEPAPDMFPESVPVPLGEPADAATVAAVTATVREVIACFNAGSFVRAFALYSEALQQQFGPEPEDTVADVQAFLEMPDEPLPADEQTRLVAVTDVSVMADGRVGAFVVLDDPQGPPDGAETALLLLVQGDDRWLVDAIVPFTEVDEDGE
jgi:hypothetical protein